ncbi:MAG TPA: hypothetical protein VFK07_00280 [Candidatus Paceibacterota bacterium]|nr:hypothetical protein [Candidatus Paceibacterota bacterium]
MRELSDKQIQEAFDYIFKIGIWPKGLQQGMVHTRLHDDREGEFQGELEVLVGPDGDAWIRTTHPDGEMLRFRTFSGGGQSVRVRNALLLLAKAIELDNTERPQQRP